MMGAEEEQTVQRRAMDSGAEKCVLIIDEQLPAGLAVNTGVVLAFTLGSRLAALIGPDVLDGSGQIHPGITTLPFPILKARADQIKAIRLRAGEMESLFVVDFTDAAQTSKEYHDYTAKLAALTSEELQYLGLALYGKREAVSKLTGSLPLLR
jgi:hypothetical protein